MERAEELNLREQIERAAWECDRAIAHLHELLTELERQRALLSGMQADELIKININPF